MDYDPGDYYSDGEDVQDHQPPPQPGGGDGVEIGADGR